MNKYKQALLKLNDEIESRPLPSEKVKRWSRWYYDRAILGAFTPVGIYVNLHVLWKLAHLSIVVWNYSITGQWVWSAADYD